MGTSTGRRPHGAAIVLGAAVIALAGCEKPGPPPVPTCQPPSLLAIPSPTAEDLAHDTLFNCVKQVAYQGVLRGGAVKAAATAAVDQCAPAQAAYLKAIAKVRRLSAYERGVIRGQVEQLAQSTAVRKRSRGCGRPGGEPESLMDTDSR